VDAVDWQTWGVAAEKFLGETEQHGAQCFPVAGRPSGEYLSEGGGAGLIDGCCSSRPPAEVLSRVARRSGGSGRRATSALA